MGMKAYPREHGTMRGYKQHEWQKEKVCRKCLDARAAHVREYRKNSETYEKYIAEYREKNRDLLNAKKRDWVARNNDRVNEVVRARYSRKKEHILKQRRDRYHNLEDVREKNLERNRVRAALRRDPNWVFYSIEDVLEKYGTDCHICEEPIDFNAPRKVGIEGWEKGLHLDHFIPLTKGGGDSIENMRPSHGICNIRKGNKLKFGAN